MDGEYLVKGYQKGIEPVTLAGCQHKATPSLMAVFITWRWRAEVWQRRTTASVSESF